LFLANKQQPAMKIFSIMLAVAAIAPPTAAFSTLGVAFRPASTQTGELLLRLAVVCVPAQM
jgi:hypothetical protein